jgi:hypothetical protein
MRTQQAFIYLFSQFKYLPLEEIFIGKKNFILKETDFYDFLDFLFSAFALGSDFKILRCTYSQTKIFRVFQNKPL